jgi:hypothetical protein
MSDERLCRLIDAVEAAAGVDQHGKSCFANRKTRVDLTDTVGFFLEVRGRSLLF